MTVVVAAWQRRRRISRALTRVLADDADLVAIFLDEHGAYRC
jgi:hypothetical protein